VSDLRAGINGCPVSPTAAIDEDERRVRRIALLEARIEESDRLRSAAEQRADLAEKQRDIAIVNKGYRPPGQPVNGSGE
jgi:hypothetical protein